MVLQLLERQNIAYRKKGGVVEFSSSDLSCGALNSDTDEYTRT
jgi:hypothetical protein